MSWICCSISRWNYYMFSNCGAVHVSSFLKISETFVSSFVHWQRCFSFSKFTKKVYSLDSTLTIVVVWFTYSVWMFCVRHDSVQ